MGGVGRKQRGGAGLVISGAGNRETTKPQPTGPKEQKLTVLKTEGGNGATRRGFQRKKRYRWRKGEEWSTSKPAAGRGEGLQSGEVEDGVNVG